ncbi:Putative ATPase subunit of terminase (gpP-like) [Psychroflexus salarius]|uniref:Putative ATPase subunit of terminase (GpP-like) n=1 Tax=Psychroflexus salarius TaxID=1155689 RepID=A0A1M4SDD9_9FLAO|nr:helix-turn-helix domain-containing protein [Psychroflexus salarius]SHE30229.1 Putative ATPase subunit of terminase (gpP-like) [Psychroflexus salarius]
MKNCPQCRSIKIIKSGIINNRQRYHCKNCNYYFTVNKLGKQIDNYYVIKAMQLYLEGLSYREIERILGVSHVSIMNWVKKYKVNRIKQTDYHPTYKILSHSELANYFNDREQLSGAGVIITELGDKFMLIKWERFKE